MPFPRKKLEDLLANYPGLRLAILFGSLAKGRERPGSDVDLAVAAKEPMAAEDKARLIEAVALLTGRPVDLVDLHTANGLIMKEALAGGEMLFCADRTLYANFIQKMLRNEADWMPYRRRILAERRLDWISA